MKIAFVNVENCVQTDDFEIKENPYKVGDIVRIHASVYKKSNNTGENDITEVLEPNMNGKFKIIEIQHNIIIQTIITDNYTYDKTLIFIERIK